MMKIAKEVEDIKKRPWFKRLDAEEQSIALAKMTAPANKTWNEMTPEERTEATREMNAEFEKKEPEGQGVKMKSGTNDPNEPMWYITTTFKAHNLEKIRDNQFIQNKLKQHITTICREHGISRMEIHYEEKSGGGSRPVTTHDPAPVGPPSP